MGFHNGAKITEKAGDGVYRFFVEPEAVQESRIRISGPDAHHMKHVLRMNPGETVLISCQDEWEYTCRIEAYDGDAAELRIIDMQKPGKELPSRITLYQCLPKKEKMELIIQKSIELGVFEIVPVESARCIVKTDPKKLPAKLARWNAVAQAAAKQSKRMIEPRVLEPVRFDQAVRQAAEKAVSLIPYERAEGMPATRQVLENIRPGQEIGILIGPEGGFEEAEIEMAKEAGIVPITLGKRILRTETAGPAVLAILMYLLEEA